MANKYSEGALALVDRKQCAAACGVSQRTITNWLRARVIPCVRVSRVVRFDMAKVKNALERFESKEVTRPPHA